MKRKLITLRGLRVEDAVLYLLLEADVIDEIISDARLMAAIQNLYQTSGKLLRYRMRGYSDGGVKLCVRKVMALWSLRGLLPLCLEEVEAGVIVKRKAENHFRGRFCRHVQAHLEDNCSSFKGYLVSDKLPESNPVGCEINELPIAEEAA